MKESLFQDNNGLLNDLKKSSVNCFFNQLIKFQFQFCKCTQYQNKHAYLYFHFLSDSLCVKIYFNFVDLDIDQTCLEDFSCLNTIK